ncbi:hypothetical protein D039_1668B, partial [Vibrio parahaemolyticus EKP-028]
PGCFHQDRQTQE